MWNDLLDSQVLRNQLTQVDGLSFEEPRHHRQPIPTGYLRDPSSDIYDLVLHHMHQLVRKDELEQIFRVTPVNRVQVEQHDEGLGDHVEPLALEAILAKQPPGDRTGNHARMAIDLIRSGEIMTMSQEIIQPFYERKAFQTLEWFREELGDVPCRIHKPEGALFLWLWFQELPCTSAQLYDRLKARNTLIIPGHHFFPGLENEYWQHKHECIRVTYAQDEAVVHEGVKVIADEVRKLYA